MILMLQEDLQEQRELRVSDIANQHGVCPPERCR